MDDYDSFVAKKLSTVPPTGITGELSIPDSLFPHQRALVQWALRRGRCAIFADTGLGKSRMQLAWAQEVYRCTGRSVLILAPLAVAAQTVREGADIGVKVSHVRDGGEVGDAGLYITNYERMHLFDPSVFGAVVLDESSCIKHHTTKTLAALLEAFDRTPFKLCATATPAPNDWTELGTHAEFLGICTRSEMLAEYFVHDGGETQTWRLKGHARAQFWRWVSTWGAMVRRPSDLGFDDSRYELPPLSVHQHTVTIPNAAERVGMLFAMEAQTLSERRDARRESIADRVKACAELVFQLWEKSSGCSEASSPQGIHAGVLQGQSFEIQSKDSGVERKEERREAREVSGGCRVSEQAQGVRQGVAGGEPGEKEVTKAAPVRSVHGPIQGNDECAVGEVSDLRILGHQRPEHISGCRSLPRLGKGARASVHAVQSGDWKIQGQPGASDGGCGVLEPVLIWCDLNAEQDALRAQFGDLAFSVQGSDESDVKESRIRAWLRGERPVMISKCSIMGWGLNFQHCRIVCFVGVTDSWESYYQAVRRCWRFGQKNPVDVHIFASDLEGAVVTNLRRKEADALAMAESLSAETREAVMRNVVGLVRESNSYNAARTVSVPAWLRSEAA